MTFPFTSKETYLAWRAQWRADYAALSKRIRELKAQRTDPDPIIRACAQSHAHTCRKRAHQMLEDRKESKVQAQSQYQAAKAAQAA